MSASAECKCVSDPLVEELAEMLKVISDPNRLRIICLLQGGERCVCELEDQMGISQPLVSHHLGVLKEAGLLNMRREGTWSHYPIDTKKLRRLERVFKECLEGEGVKSASRNRKVC